ncbi:MAG: RlmE family RNA methyltransferase [Candidatus Thermoplasmatota archaeon]|nr:RlmE family RNA methyltransferase [Candidatus Thermoplasmatota archaeon]MCL5881737.1 RlmE family RNA methyltransferase [Candidatus Thermoplasmatota archaeon]
MENNPGMPDHRDKYYYLAKKERYRSRAAFKLMEIQTKFDLLRQGQYVLEVGSSPGGWSQIITSITRNPVISVDINQMEPLDNVIFVKGKIEDPRTVERIGEIMQGAGIKHFQGIVSDAMIHTSGIHDRDHASSYLLCQSVMNLVGRFLENGGFVLLKQFQGDLTVQFVNQWKKHFRNSRTTKVSASRDSSSEIYIIFDGYVA